MTTNNRFLSSSVLGNDIASETTLKDIDDFLQSGDLTVVTVPGTTDTVLTDVAFSTTQTDSLTVNVPDQVAVNVDNFDDIQLAYNLYEDWNVLALDTAKWGYTTTGVNFPVFSGSDIYLSTPFNTINNMLLTSVVPINLTKYTSYTIEFDASFEVSSASAPDYAYIGLVDSTRTNGIRVGGIWDGTPYDRPVKAQIISSLPVSNTYIGGDGSIDPIVDATYKDFNGVAFLNEADGSRNKYRIVLTNTGSDWTCDMYDMKSGVWSRFHTETGITSFDNSSDWYIEQYISSGGGGGSKGIIQNYDVSVYHGYKPFTVGIGDVDELTQRVVLASDHCGAGVIDASTQRVVLASDHSVVDTAVTKLGANDIDVGAGDVELATQRVTIATNQLTIPVREDLVPSGTNFTVHKFGRNDNVSDNVLGHYIADNEYIHWPLAATTVNIAGSAGDNSATAFTRSIVVEGLDANWDRQSEVLVFDTVGVIVNSANTYIRLNRAYIKDQAAYIGTNASDILVQDVGTTFLLTILAGMGQTQTSNYTVPKGYTAYLEDITVAGDVSNTPSTYYLATLWQKQGANVFSYPFSGVRLVWQSEIFEGSIHQKFNGNVTFPEMTDIWAQGRRTTNGSSPMSVHYNLKVVKN